MEMEKEENIIITILPLIPPFHPEINSHRVDPIPLGTDATRHLFHCNNTTTATIAIAIE